VAIGTLAGYLAHAGISSTDATRDASLSAILVTTEAAIKRLCYPFLFEPQTLTDVILDAPWASDTLLLPALPVRSITSLYYNPAGKGLAANFDSTHLLSANVDYQLVIDDFVNNWSRAGRVRRLNRSVWGVGYLRPLGRLGFGPQPEAGSIKLTAAVGCASVPAEVSQALYLATALVYARRSGAPVTSSSWNGYSESLAGPFTTTAAVNSPDVMQLLAPYVSQIRLGS
jgi:hypothetical protein